MGKEKLPTKRFAIYLRCSTDEQGDGEFTTIDAQRTITSKHVEACKGELVQEYVDDGVSGTKIKRPGIDKLVRDAGAGKFDVVCITYMSRLGRGNVYPVLEYKLQERGVEVVTVKETFGNDLGGYLQKNMTNFMDGVYPIMVSQWTRTKLEAMIAQGFFCGGTKPLGYSAEPVVDATMSRSRDKAPPKRLVPNSEAAPIVQRAFELFAETRC